MPGRPRTRTGKRTPPVVPDARTTPIDDANIEIFETWLADHLSGLGNTLTRAEARYWLDTFQKRRRERPARRSDRGSDMMGSHAVFVIDLFRGNGYVDLITFADWWLQGLGPEGAAELAARGFTPDSYAAFLRLVCPLTESAEIHEALTAGPGWPETGIPCLRVRPYFEAGVTPEEAVTVWEPRRIAGENIHAPLEMLKALRAS